MNRMIRLSMATAAGLALCTGAGAIAQASPQGRMGAPAADRPIDSRPGATGGGSALADPVQAQSSDQQTQTTAQPASPQTAQQPQTIQMVQAQAELNTSLDAKKAKQGEAVKAKLVENVRIPNAQELPKNTVLEGHVDRVTPSENKGDSTMVVTFDKAKLKDGQEFPIKATVIALREPAMEQDNGAPAAGGMPSGGGPMPAAGGGASGERGGMGQTTANTPNNSNQAMNSPVDNNVGTNNNGSQQSNTNVPGVTLTSSIHQHASATLTSKGRNVKVPDGTQMQMAIAVIPAGVRVP